jgi:hypothetical protein
MGGVDLKADGFIAPRHDRESQAYDEDAPVEEVLNKAVRFGCIPNQKWNDRMRPRDGFKTQIGDTIAELLNPFFQLMPA